MLFLHRAERTDRLADALAAVLQEPPADPFAADVVSVPSKGVERWLAQRLSHRLGTTGAGGADGVCANVRFPSVSELLEQVGAEDPWRPDRLVWPLLDVIDECLTEPWCRTLAAYLGGGDSGDGHGGGNGHGGSGHGAHGGGGGHGESSGHRDSGGDPVGRGRRYATARRLAGLFDSYWLHRPDMLRAWSAGDDVDGAGGRLAEDLCWQAELWRWLGKRMTVPSPAERLAETCDALRQEPGRSALPGRVSVFGLTRLPAAHAALLGALAAGRDVHLWLPHPSPALWARVATYSITQPQPRDRDRTRDLPRHPLLASLGRDARELQLTLGAATGTHHPGTPFPDTLLGRLQRAIADDDPISAGGSDPTVQVHACHGPDRQVEVLREVILGLLNDKPDLEPRDILVMCPDIETFAPLISASFGLGADADHPAHRLRVRLADRALRQLNPLFGVVAHLLDLAGSRVTAAQVLDFAALPPVRHRWRFDDDDLDRLRELVVGAGVRWGLDPEHRSRFLVTARANTWAAGLDRILLGVAMAEAEEPHWLGTALPLDDMDSSDVDLAGRLAELVDRLTAVLDGFHRRQPLSAWREAIGEAVDMLAAVPESDAWQQEQLRAELAELTAETGDLMLEDVRSLLAERLRGSPTRANFRTGDLTMCTMVPMRSVPHRVICVLGLDDGVFPRGSGLDGDDVLGRNPCVGERDPRGEDRQLLLDAVMAATECLVLLYSGADERTNARRPPAVPLDELLDALGDAGEHVVTRHPLQPFDARNFAAAKPFSFDRTALAGAVAAAGDRTAEPPFLPAPLAPIDAEVVELGDLLAFFHHPVRAFARRRLGVGFPGDDGEPADGLPIELDALQKWAVGERLLRSLLAGTELTRCVQAEWRRGTVPPGPLGTRLLSTIAAEVEPLAAAAATHLTGTPEAVDVTVALPDGRSLTGTVGDVHGNTTMAVSYSRLAPKHRLRAWLTLLALTAGRPGTPWRAVTIGRGPSRSTFGPVDPASAVRQLHALVTLADEGLREPLPLIGKASHAYAQCVLSGGSRESGYARARAEWTRFEGTGEADDPAHRMVWGPEAPLPEPDRFAALAVRLWEPLCRAETTDRPG